MAFLFVQDVANATAGGTSLVITLGSAATVNNLLVLNMKFIGTSVTNISVTDNASTPNTYAQAVSFDGASNRNVQFYGVQRTGGATTVTVSWTTSVAARIVIDEFSGGNTTNATVFDKSATTSGTATSGSFAAFSPSTAGSLVSVAYLSSTMGTFTAGTNYTTGQNGTNASTEYRLSSTTSETAPASWTNSVAFAGIAGVYKVATVATVPTAPVIGTATAGNTQAIVTYSTSSSDGGATITGYTATSTPGSFTGSVSGATASPITVTGLTNGTPYTFTVHATNSVGNSAESSASNSVTPAVAPPTVINNGGASSKMANLSIANIARL